jgi:voltage-gated potassium channel Kch
LCAAVCGYLLLGVVWTDIYTVVDVMIVRDPGASSGFVSSTSSKVSFGDLLYFSYTTLTTTGYGDIIPKDPVIRMLAVLEAIVGVFYNTIVIARFVGLYGVKPQPTKDSSSQ